MRFKARRKMDGLDDNGKSKHFPAGSLLPLSVRDWPAFRALKNQEWILPIDDEEVQELKALEAQQVEDKKLDEKKERLEKKMEPSNDRQVQCEDCGAYFKNQRSISNHKKSCTKGSLI